ncbi:MAG: STM4011 family radical SAM protein [Planctomycetota bacterium]
MSGLPPLLRLLYRGSLGSCNYACAYCPFAKATDSREVMQRDREEVERFVDWARGYPGRLGVLFTPWGEALVRPWYRAALVALSRLEHVERVAIQTNLAAPLDFVDDADLDALALWATYHPSQTSRERFLDRIAELERRGARYSVGVVGLREHFAELRALRAALPAHVYLWVNAYKRDPAYYAPDEVAWLTELDPHFALNRVYHESLGAACRTGASVLSVDGAGGLRRCHFVDAPLGNLYTDPLEAVLAERPCPNARCGCFIGYAHLERLELEREFGPNLLERIRLPVRPAVAPGGPAPTMRG